MDELLADFLTETNKTLAPPAGSAAAQPIARIPLRPTPEVS
jgi:hypothetical protein